MNIDEPLVSFVVPCYNHGAFIGDCLNSILGQEGTFKFEIVVVDDASKDESPCVIRSYSDPRIRCFFHEMNQGHVITINEGFQRARGKFIARIDADDRYRSNYLLEVLEKFQKYPEVGLVYGNVALINKEGQVTQKNSDIIHQGRDFKGNEFIKLLEKNFVPAPTVIARREAWGKALPIPAGLGFSDWYLTLMISRKYDFYYIDQPLADYRVHQGNLHSKMIQDKTQEETIFNLLEKIFKEEETTELLKAQKIKAQHRIYGAQYLDMATKYFGCQYTTDARRCFLKAFRYWPKYMLQGTVLRHFIATFIKPKNYKTLKTFLKSMRIHSCF